MEGFLQLIVYFSFIVIIILLLLMILFTVIFLKILIVSDKMIKAMRNCDEDMAGKTVLITGATAGIGKETAIDLARRNARVILACRNVEKARNVVQEIVSATGNTNLEIKHLDLSSFDSVRKCAKDVLKTEKKLHVLINNAGMNDFDVHITQDGCEKVMQSNHLGHFLLTLLLLDLLKKSSPSRIINVASTMYFGAYLDTKDMNGDKHNRWLLALGNLYSRSKLANILFTRELANKLVGTGVTVNAVHPGILRTDIVQKPRLFSFGNYFKILVYFFGKDSKAGAQPIIYTAVHPDLGKTSGEFFCGCQKQGLFRTALSKKLAKRLFEMSEKIVGMTFESA